MATTQQSLDQQLLDAAKAGKSQYMDLYNQQQQAFNQTFSNVGSYDYRNLLGATPKATEVQYGDYKLTKGERLMEDGTGWDTFNLVDAQGNVIKNIKHTGSISTRDEIKRALAEQFGSGLLASSNYSAQLKGLQNIAQQYGDTSLGDNVASYWDNLYKQQQAQQGNYGTFINAAGQQVVATDPEKLANMKALGFKQVAEGTTQLTAEQSAQSNQTRTQVEQQIQQGLASGAIDQATADKLMAGMQTGDTGAGVVAPQPQATTYQAAGFAGGDVQTSPSGASVNSSTGMLTTASGQQISPQDPNYQTMLTQEGLTLPAGAQQASAGQLSSGAVQPYVADPQAAQSVEQLRAQLGNQPATTDLIQSAFKAYHGREANAQELQRYASMGAEQATREIIGGAPQPFTKEEASLIQQNYERILNPDELTQLAQNELNFDPSQLITIGNKLFKPDVFKPKDKEVTASVTDFMNTDSMKLDNYSSYPNSDLNDGDINLTIEDYMNQMLSQTPEGFKQTQSAYYKALLSSDNFREKTLLGLEDQYQIDELSDKLTDLDAQIAAARSSLAFTLTENANQPVSMARIVGRGQHIQNVANAQIEGLLAQKDQLLGQYDRAQQRIENMYTAKVGDYQQKIDTLKTFYEDQKEFFTKAEERMYQDKIRKEEREFETKKVEWAFISNLALKYPEAGVSIYDSVSDAVSKIAEQAKKENDFSGVFDFSSMGGDGLAGNIQSALQSIPESQRGMMSAQINGREVQAPSFIIDKLMKADAEMKAAGLSGLLINESLRDSATQQRYYDAYQYRKAGHSEEETMAKYGVKGGQAAPPGSSFHGAGLAVDVANYQEAEAYLRKYGLVNDLANDKNHFSYGETNNVNSGGGESSSVGYEFFSTPSNLATAANNLISSTTSKFQQDSIKNTIKYYAKKGDLQSMGDYIKTQTINNLLSTSENETYQQFDLGEKTQQQALSLLNSSDVNFGPYKALYQDKAPYLLMRKDPKYSEISALIEAGQSQLRKGFYGTAVTGTEEENAKKFLISPEDDLATIKIKATNLSAFLKFANDKTIARKLGLSEPKLQSYFDAINTGNNNDYNQFQNIINGYNIDAPTASSVSGILSWFTL